VPAIGSRARSTRAPAVAPPKMGRRLMRTNGREPSRSALLSTKNCHVPIGALHVLSIAVACRIPRTGWDNFSCQVLPRWCVLIGSAWSRDAGGVGFGGRGIRSCEPRYHQHVTPVFNCSNRQKPSKPE
jgi:hypothetical protein